MSFHTDSETVVVHPGEGASVTIGGSRCIFKLTGRDTNDRFALFASPGSIASGDPSSTAMAFKPAAVNLSA
jgi:hypothetical protein